MNAQVIFKLSGSAELHSAKCSDYRRRPMALAILLADIGSEDRTLLAGHLGDVAGRHRIGPCRHTADQTDVAMDVLGSVEQDALRRGYDAGPDRFGRVAHATAGHYDLLDIGERGLYRQRACLYLTRAGRGEQQDRNRACRSYAPHPPRRFASGMP